MPYQVASPSRTKRRPTGPPSRTIQRVCRRRRVPSSAQPCLLSSLPALSSCRPGPSVTALFVLSVASVTRPLSITPRLSGVALESFILTLAHRRTRAGRPRCASSIAFRPSLSQTWADWASAAALATGAARAGAAMMRAALQLAIRPDFESAPPRRPFSALRTCFGRRADLCLPVSVLVVVLALVSFCTFSYLCVRRSHP